MQQIKVFNQITYRVSESLEKYLQEIAKIPLLSHEEEGELTKQIKKGDTAALEKLTKSNLRFVVSVAKQYQYQKVPLSDLINEGNIGLIKAAKAFDETRGFKFISYAVWWIRASIIRALAEQTRIVRFPMNKIDSYSKINKAMQMFEQKFQREPTDDELGCMVNLDSRDIASLTQGMKSAKKHVSMDEPMSETEASTLHDVMKDNDASDIEDALMNDALKNEIRKALAFLPVRDNKIVAAYFGLNEDRPMTLEEIGSQFNLSKERVRQIKKHSLQKIKRGSSSKTLELYLSY